MRHVQHFKDNFDQPLHEVVATDDQAVTSADSVQMHEDDSHVRNLCFVWPDGRMAFFNYAYLVSADLVLSDMLNVILLSFSGQTVLMKGYSLASLFDLLLNHSPKTITAQSPRYVINPYTANATVTEIIVKNE